MNIGIFGQFPASKYAIFQPELVFSMQGAAADKSRDDLFNYNYLNLPLLLRIYPGGGWGEGFHFHLGPQVGFLLSGKLSSDGIDVDVRDQLRALDLALGFGLGYDGRLLTLDFRYNLGLNSTLKGEVEESFPDRTLQVSLGYKIK